nr:MAG TPA: hypothetical protein [Caudoviricetes sp.]
MCISIPVDFQPLSWLTSFYGASKLLSETEANPVRVAIFVPCQDILDALGVVYHTIFTGRE